jgi:DNA-binding GntR family transcriptional regulator
VANIARSKSQLVYDRLRAAITAGEVASGHRLVLDQLATQYGVSTVPVREAIRRLEAEGFVTFTPNVGAQVAAIDLTDYTEAMETLAYLESAVTALAVPHMTEARIARAEAMNRQMGELVAAESFIPAAFADLNRAFHTELAHAGHNDHMLGLLEREWDRLSIIRRGTYSVDRERATGSVAEHSGILDLLRAGAPTEEVERAAREHKLTTMRHYLATHRR